MKEKKEHVFYVIREIIWLVCSPILESYSSRKDENFVDVFVFFYNILWNTFEISNAST